MTKSSKSDPFFDKFLDGIEPEIAATFTAAQLQAIKRSFSSRSWNRHPLDIRLSVPVPGRRFYLVIVGGPERREASRIREQNREYPLLTVTNTLVIAVCFVVLATSVLGLFYGLLDISSTLTSPSTRPSASPVITDKAQCEQTGKKWSNGQCSNY